MTKAQDQTAREEETDDMLLEALEKQEEAAKVVASEPLPASKAIVSKEGVVKSRCSWSPEGILLAVLER